MLRSDSKPFVDLLTEPHLLTSLCIAFVQDLLGSILSVMGLNPNTVSASDTLSRLGIDSMQMVEVRPAPTDPERKAK